RVAGEVLVVAPEHRSAGFPVPVAEPTFVDTTTGVNASLAPAESLRVQETATERDVPALLAGLALRGVRAAALATATGDLAAGLAAAAGRRLPYVVHLADRARTRQASSPHGAHDGYHDLADSGAFLMFARNAQEVADYALIARRIAERALSPGVCAHDRGETSHAVRNVDLAGSELSAAYLGLASDTIACPTDAQTVLFGPLRRRVPVLLDPDRPAGIGGTQDAENHLRAVAAGRAFFAEHLPAMVDDAMREFGTLTGRPYQRAAGYRLDDAEYVVVAQGAVVDELAAVVDFLRAQGKIKAGLLNIAVLRPFPTVAVSRLLAGKRAVTVLERSDAQLAGDPPLLRDIRGAIDRATENGAARAGELPHPEHAVYRRREDRPFLLSGVYGVGTTLPGLAQLAAVFENMTRDAAARHFYLGAGFEVETRRFPHLQTLRQRLDREYPGAARLSLEAAPATLDPRRNDGAVTIVSHSAQGALFAGNMFAQALAAATGWRVQSYPEGGIEPSLQPSRIAIAFQRKTGAACTRPLMTDAVLVSGEQLIETVAADATLRHEGTLVAGSVRAPEDLWKGLSKRAADWTRTQAISFHVLDARRIAAETALHPSFIDQLSIWALLGAWARIHLGLSMEQSARLEDALRGRLRAEPGVDDALADEIVRTCRRGAAEHAAVPWTEWRGFAHPVGEPETPWTVRQLAERDGTVFDAARFWHSVGYLYDRGQPASTLADPYLATAILPARSSAFRDMTPYRLRMPSWLPENCTGCGACWTQCPESALPATVRTLPELVDAAMRSSERAGPPFVQLKRLADNLAKFTLRAVARKGPQPYRSLSALLTDAFARLVDKAGLDGDKLVAARAEFERLLATVDRFPVAATEPFFTKPEGAAAGSGRLLSIALNPMSCTACGICVTECTDGALEWVEQTPERVAAARGNWDFLMALPPARAEAIAALVTPDDPATNVNRLLDGGAYHALIGGGGSVPGNGARTAVHLVAASIESVMRPRFAAHAARLASLIGKIEDRIQGKVQSGVRVNDFEEFSRRLQRLDRAEITPAALVDVTGGDGRTIDTAQLTRLSQLLHDLKGQRRSYESGGTGSGRACFVLAIDPASGGFGSETYPYNPHPQPWAAQHAGDAIAMAGAVSEALIRHTVAELSLCHRAEAELRDAPAEPALLAWRDLTPEERGLVPRVLVLTRPDAATIEGAWNVLARDLPVTIAVLDGDGIATNDVAGGAATGRLDTLLATVARGGHHVAQSSIGAAGHLMQSVIESVTSGGPALLRVYAPDPQSSGIAPDRVAELARIAVESRAVPVFVGRGGCDPAGNPDPDRAWTSTTMRFTEPSGPESSLDVTLTVADWAVKQARFRPHYRVVSKGHRSAAMKPMAEYLALDAGAREGIQPYIDVRDRNGRHAIALVSREMTDAIARAAARWDDIRAAVAPAPAKPAPSVTDAAPAPAAAAAAATLADTHRRLAENLLRLSGFGGEDPLFKRSLREFVARGRGSNGDAE
ncbi:MAG TPA: 2-oxoacid:acceptor oxidoreductase family protein, partial [Candidatus Krumholzibacteria bacterium]|nr:2-oxoacid:acceptor oxidoreductase family protein [Candidatus Krumholzibacteria bacterium]